MIKILIYNWVLDEIVSENTKKKTRIDNSISFWQKRALRKNGRLNLTENRPAHLLGSDRIFGDLENAKNVELKKLSTYNHVQRISISLPA